MTGAQSTCALGAMISSPPRNTAQAAGIRRLGTERLSLLEAALLESNTPLRENECRQRKPGWGFLKAMKTAMGAGSPKSPLS